MQHLIAEGNEMISECEDDDTRDAVMIAAAQKVEHYEIASYGTIRTWANLLGKGEIASILEDILEEEKAADLKLTGIAESFVNEAAVAAAMMMTRRKKRAPPIPWVRSHDDEVSARFLKRLLTHEGHHVSIAKTAEGVLQVCATDAPDLVLLDLGRARAGRASRSAASSRSRRSTRFVPVVIVTAQSDRADRLRGIEAGCDDFLIKPFDSTELHARIRSLVRLKRYTDELESAESVILGLGATIEARDPSTNGHCQRLAHYATKLGGLARAG